MVRIPPKEFDCIVVVAGSAGCVIASRLSEEPDVSVLLIEAGASASGLFRDMPVAIAQAIRRQELDWGFKSELEPDLNGRQLEVRRCKVLGDAPRSMFDSIRSREAKRRRADRQRAWHT